MMDATLKEQVENLERKLIEEALVAEGGCREAVKRRLGIPTRTLYNKISKYKLTHLAAKRKPPKIDQLDRLEQEARAERVRADDLAVRYTELARAVGYMGDTAEHVAVIEWATKQRLEIT